MKRYLIVLLCAVVLSSCERELNFKFKSYNPKLVVNALLNNREVLTVSVSSSVPFSIPGNPQVVENAIVTLFIDGVKQPRLTYNGFNKVYSAPVIPQPGREYRILVEAPGFISVTSEAMLPGSGNFAPASFKDSVYVDSSGFPLGQITVRIDDDAAQENYYRLKLFYYERTFGEFMELPVDAEDPLVNQFASRLDGGVVFSDATFNGQKRVIYFKTPFGYGQGTPKFLVLKEHLSKDYYLYVTSLNRYQNAGSNLFQEPVFVYSNVREGLGIFSGYQEQRDTLR
jgi:hypothetical protein